MFPPNLSLFDDHDCPDSIVNPVIQLRDSFARVQAHVARLDGDEHQEQRDVLMQQIETATQELAEISPTLHSIANLRISINSQVQPANQITLEFNGKELTDTAGPAPFVEPFTEPYAETADNSATDEFDATEVTVEHSTATRTPASIRKAGMFSPGGLSMVVIQTGTALSLFAIVCLTVFPDATVDVFSNATAAQIYNCVPVAQRHRLFLHRLNPRTLTLTTMGEWEVRRGQNPAKSVFPSVSGVKRCAKSNRGCQSDGQLLPDISGSRLGFGASSGSKSPCPGSVLSGLAS
jgi:hypothetical protein